MNRLRMTTDASAKDNWRAENLNSSLMTLLLQAFGLRHIVLSAHMFFRAENELRRRPFVTVANCQLPVIAARPEHLGVCVV